jgi:hypothetical protein
LDFRDKSNVVQGILERLFNENKNMIATEMRQILLKHKDTQHPKNQLTQGQIDTVIGSLSSIRKEATDLVKGDEHKQASVIKIQSAIREKAASLLNLNSVAWTPSNFSAINKLNILELQGHVFNKSNEFLDGLSKGELVSKACLLWNISQGSVKNAKASTSSLSNSSDEACTNDVTLKTSRAFEKRNFLLGININLRSNNTGGIDLGHGIEISTMSEDIEKVHLLFLKR